MTAIDTKHLNRMAPSALRREAMILQSQLIGTQDETIYIEFSTERLSSLGISAATVISTIQAQNAVMPAGFENRSMSQISMDPNLPAAVAALRAQLQTQPGLTVNIPEILNAICARFEQASSQRGEAFLLRRSRRHQRQPVEDGVALEIASRRDVVMGCKEAGIVGAQHLLDLLRRPDVEFSFLAFGIGNDFVVL